MKVIMIAVTSANGKLTRNSDPNIYKWTSKEDQDFFFSKITKSKLIVMSSGTYEAARRLIKHKKGRLRIVLTRSPNKYSGEQIPGQLEFSSEKPEGLARRLSEEGYKQMLLVGGGEINSIFLREGLVDEIYLTIEPVVFGQGKNLFAESEFESKLKLQSVKKLNKKGTLLLKYRVIK